VRWRRRALTFSVLGLASLLSFALAPLLLPLAAAFDLLRSKPALPTVRFGLMVLVYLGLEIWGLLSALGLALASSRRSAEENLTANFHLQWRWVGLLFAALRSLFRLRVTVEGGELAREGPFLLLVRHASVGDTLLPTTFVSAPHGIRLRFVLKHELLYDPCLDVVGQRIPNLFVRRSGRKRESEKIRALARDLGPRDAVLVYPEGTRFSAEKRERRIARLEESKDAFAADRARALSHVLPPRMGGFLAVLETSAPLDVVILTHHGLDGVRRLSDLWDGSLLDALLVLSFRRFPADTIPASNAERQEWLHARWKEVDEWVRERARTEASLPSAPGSSSHPTSSP
jgi:1-acyl-sn-glycerol-3-phosphate acyltransferase